MIMLPVCGDSMEVQDVMDHLVLDDEATRNRLGDKDDRVRRHESALVAGVQHLGNPVPAHRVEVAFQSQALFGLRVPRREGGGDFGQRRAGIHHGLKGVFTATRENHQKQDNERSHGHLGAGKGEQAAPLRTV